MWPLPFDKYRHLPNIVVPQGAYKFLAAMDKVIRQMPVEEPTHPGWQKSIGFRMGLMFLMESHILPFHLKKAMSPQ
jgi:hypothetical protein